MSVRMTLSKFKLCDDTLFYPGCCAHHDRLSLEEKSRTAGTNGRNGNGPSGSSSSYASSSGSSPRSRIVAGRASSGSSAPSARRFSRISMLTDDSESVSHPDADSLQLHITTQHHSFSSGSASSPDLPNLPRINCEKQELILNTDDAERGSGQEMKITPPDLGWYEHECVTPYAESDDTFCMAADLKSRDDRSTSPPSRMQTPVRPELPAMPLAPPPVPPPPRRPGLSLSSQIRMPSDYPLPDDQQSVSTVSGSGIDFFRKFVQKRSRIVPDECPEVGLPFQQPAKEALIDRLVSDSLEQSAIMRDSMGVRGAENGADDSESHRSSVSVSTVSGSGFLFLKNYLQKKKKRAKERKDVDEAVAESNQMMKNFNSVAIPFPPPSNYYGPAFLPEREAFLSPTSSRRHSLGSTIADLLNETFDSEDSELRNLEWGDGEESDPSEVVDIDFDQLSGKSQLSRESGSETRKCQGHSTAQDAEAQFKPNRLASFWQNSLSRTDSIPVGFRPAMPSYYSPEWHSRANDRIQNFFQMTRKAAHQSGSNFLPSSRLSNFRHSTESLTLSGRFSMSSVSSKKT